MAPVGLSALYLLPRRLDSLALEDFLERPGVALGGPADHHGSRAGCSEHGLGTSARDDVAGGDHGYVHQRDELRRERVISHAGVHLLGRARVQGDGCGTCFNEPRPDRQAGARAVLEATAQLDRHGYRDR